MWWLLLGTAVTRLASHSRLLALRFVCVLAVGATYSQQFSRCSHFLGGSIGSIGRSGKSFAAYYMFIQGVFKVGVGLMEDPRAIDISSITAELNGAFALKLIGRGHWMFID